eukprot:2385069-Prymnesium_polylepis.3
MSEQSAPIPRSWQPAATFKVFAIHAAQDAMHTWLDAPVNGQSKSTCFLIASVVVGVAGLVEQPACDCLQNNVVEALLIALAKSMDECPCRIRVLCFDLIQTHEAIGRLTDGSPSR